MGIRKDDMGKMGSLLFLTVLLSTALSGCLEIRGVALNGLESRVSTPTPTPAGPGVPTLSYAHTNTLGYACAAGTFAPSAFSANQSPTTCTGTIPALAAGLSLDASTCTISGTLNTAVTKTYTVSAVNSYGTTTADITISFSPAIPAVPTGPSANDTISSGNPAVQVQWSSVCGATQYVIKRSTTQGGPYSAVTSSAIGTSYIDTVPTAGVTYYYVVDANNSAGTGSDSTEVSATPRWMTVATAGAPSAREIQSMNWTGSQVLIWGGLGVGAVVGDGFRYDPVANSWSAMSSTSAPAARTGFARVWTGKQLLIWGGRDNTTTCVSGYSDGFRYNPVLNSWSAMSASPLSIRCSYSFEWSGTEMYVVGGYDSDVINDSAKYNPTLDTWTSIAAFTSALASRANVQTVWTGSKILIWGGHDSMPTWYQDGATYDPSNDTWTVMPVNAGSAPSARRLACSIWTGTEFIVWGGQGGGGIVSDGGRYNPATGIWTPMAASPLAARFNHFCVWGGSKLYVWGGISATSSPLSDGAIYDVLKNSWTPLSTGGVPSARGSGWNACFAQAGFGAVRTGAQILYWGGYDGTSVKNDGSLYIPPTWTTISSTSAPAARQRNGTANAVWTGSQVVVWGGTTAGYASFYNDGARYDPVANTWTAMSTTGAPSARTGNAIVYTGVSGKEIVVWGGTAGTGLNYADGATYNLTTNAWTAMAASTLSGGSPSAAVWTGSQVLIWGIGQFGGMPSAQGARYNVAANTWSAMATTGQPAARAFWANGGVWTGSKMLMWGGYDGSSWYNDGFLYDPTGNAWTTMAASPMSSRVQFTPVWTGTKLVIWGGAQGGIYYADGAMYDPSLDQWTSMASTNAPSARVYYAADWNGTHIVYYGGQNSGGTRLSDVKEFDPLTNTWYTGSVLNNNFAARIFPFTAMIKGKFFIWGGSGASSALSDGMIYEP